VTGLILRDLADLKQLGAREGFFAQAALRYLRGARKIIEIAHNALPSA
jgi:hypothetical protein